MDTSAFLLELASKYNLDDVHGYDNSLVGNQTGYDISDFTGSEDASGMSTSSSDGVKENLSPKDTNRNSRGAHASHPHRRSAGAKGAVLGVVEDERLQELVAQQAEQIRSLQASKQLLERECESNFNTYQQAMAAKNKEIESLSAQLRAASVDNPANKSNVAYIKESLKDFIIPQTTYLEYKKTDADKQSLVQYVTVRVHEMLASERERRDALLLDLQRLREQCQRSSEELDRLSREKETVQKSFMVREQELIDQVAYLEVVRKRHNEELAGQNISL
jgi:hypothetical protein